MRVALSSPRHGHRSVDCASESQRCMISTLCMVLGAPLPRVALPKGVCCLLSNDIGVTSWLSMNNIDRNDTKPRSLIRPARSGPWGRDAAEGRSAAALARRVCGVRRPCGVWPTTIHPVGITIPGVGCPPAARAGCRSPRAVVGVPRLAALSLLRGSARLADVPHCVETP